METPITKVLQDRINKHKDRQFKQAINKSCCRANQETYKEIPWFKMPTAMRALPMNKREQALKEYEAKHGKYDWKKGMEAMKTTTRPMSKVI